MPTILLRKRKLDLSEVNQKVTIQEVESSSLLRPNRIILLKTLPGHSLETVIPNHETEQVLEKENDELFEDVRTDGHDYVIESGEQRCNSCDESFPDRSSLIIHKTEKSIQRTRAALREPILRYRCGSCLKIFASKGLLNRHFKDCTGSQDTILEGFQAKYPRRVRKRRPKVKTKENHEEGPVTCQKCDKVFKKEKYLKVHMTTAHHEKVSCQLCDSDFGSVTELKAHMSDTHSDLTLFCEVCNKRFYSHRSLKVHMVVHARDQKLCVCEICQKTFRHEVYLRKHVQLAHVEFADRKRFQCDVCGYQTHHKACFRDHMYKHTGEDQVECDICGKHMRKNHMRMHLRIHTGEKPEICEFCGKRFSERKYLTRHRIVHTGEKPYQCQICQRKYTQRGTLTLHFRKHHPQEMSDHKKESVGKLLRDSAAEDECEKNDTDLDVVKEDPKDDQEMQEFEVLEEEGELVEEEVLEETVKSEGVEVEIPVT